ncbi:sulfite exporter TauE/SafE family protein [Halorientalis marina]|jgi:uncharacterized membrane protein YfcA|uniref:sulfite exporter TauE/SafE family protein n=1 Tax=Halorientalis marina TaxID=2931976 RepID=UPI001FF6175A|nr:sulfite exporter TauE/SafE family protein [Halorientalis marina]
MVSLIIFIGLIIIAFLAGVIGASVGPGGVLLIASLYRFTDLTPTQIAGTSSTLFIPGLMLASIVYARSGDLRMRLAITLGITSVVGTMVGVRLNQFVSSSMFGVLLSLLLVWSGCYILFRREGNISTETTTDHSPKTLYFSVPGFIIGIFGGILGIGGPVLAVPALMLLRVPIVPAVAAAQVQGLFITVSTSTNYFTSGSVSFSLVALLLLPMLTGVVIGWRLAQRVSSRKLTYSLGIILIGLGVLLFGDAVSIL